MSDDGRLMISVRVTWADGRRQRVGVRTAFAPSLIMPRDVPGGWVPVVFAREIVEYPDGWHGPFESEWWWNGDINRVRMVSFVEVVA